MTLLPSETPWQRPQPSWRLPRTSWRLSRPRSPHSSHSWRSWRTSMTVPWLPRPRPRLTPRRRPTPFSWRIVWLVVFLLKRSDGPRRSRSIRCVKYIYYVIRLLFVFWSLCVIFIITWYFPYVRSIRLLEVLLFLLVHLSNMLKLWFFRDFFDMIFQKNQL